MQYDISGAGTAQRFAKGWGAGQLSLDILPAGYYDVFEEVAQAARDTRLRWYEEIRASNAFFRQASFIPTVSSYALNNTNRNWADALNYINSGNVKTETPFDAVFAPVNNEEHVTVTQDGVNFLKQQLLAADNSQTSCTAVTQPLPNGCYTLKAKHSNKFIQPENNAGGARLRQYDGNGQTNQIFSLEWVDNASYRLNSQSTSKVVEAAGAGTGNATPVVLGDWTGGSHQKWNVEAWGDGTYKLSPRNAPGKLFDIEGVSMNNGAGVHLWDQHGGNNQRFFIQSSSCTGGPVDPPAGNCGLTKIRIYPRKDCCAGRTIGGQVQYSTVGRNGPWVTAYTITSEVANEYREYGFGGVSSIKAVRYLSPDFGYGNVAEIEFYNGSTKLTGTLFDDGAGPWNGDQNRVASKAMDGDVNTYYDSNNCCGAFLGLELSGCGGGGGCSAPVPGLSGGGNACNGQTVTLTASGCGGTYRWSNGTNGVSSINVGAGTYSVACEQGGCTSASSASVTVTANCGGGGGCTVNRVRFKFRNPGDSYMERLQGAKIQGSNDQSNWTDLHTFNENGTGNWQEKTFTGGTYQHVRFLASPTGYGELFELEFYNGGTKLSGTAFGTSGVDGSTRYASAFDGNLSTWWHGVFPGTGNYAGLSLSGCGGGGRMAAEGFSAAEPEAKGLLLVPNPATEYVELRLPTGEEVRRAACLDIQGRTLVETSQPRLFTGRLAAGTYLIRVETKAGRTYSRVLVKL